MAKRKKPKITPEEHAEAEARFEATSRLLQARIQYHLEMLRIERGLDRTPTIEEVVREVEAKVARAADAA
jgi:hypothetical protein